jgi:hypothetical protein
LIDERFFHRRRHSEELAELVAEPAGELVGDAGLLDVAERLVGVVLQELHHLLGLRLVDADLVGHLLHEFIHVVTP